MGRTGVCSDNAVAESFFATLKNEMYHLRVFPTQGMARFIVAEYIEVYYSETPTFQPEYRTLNKHSPTITLQPRRDQPTETCPGSTAHSTHRNSRAGYCSEPDGNSCHQV